MGVACSPQVVHICLQGRVWMMSLRWWMCVCVVSFSAHADYSETSEFVDQLKPPHVVRSRFYTHTHTHFPSSRLEETYACVMVRHTLSLYECVLCCSTFSAVDLGSR